MALQSSCLCDHCFPLPVPPSHALTHVAWGLLLCSEGIYKEDQRLRLTGLWNGWGEDEEGFYETQGEVCVTVDYFSF